MPDNTQSKTERRWVKPLLVASLALNLLVAGLVAGALWRHDGHLPGRESRGGDRGGSAFIAALPRDDQRALRKALRAQWASKNGASEARYAADKKVLDALRTTPLDEATLRSALSQQSDVGDQNRRLAQAVWLERVLAMQDSDRLDYASNVETRMNEAAEKRASRTSRD